MKITGFNEVTVDGIKYDLSEKRIEIIKAECDRVAYQYCGINVNVKEAVYDYLSNRDFEVIDDVLKLGGVSVDIPCFREWWFYGKKMVGTDKELKEQATEILKGLGLVIYGKVSLGSSSIQANGYVFSEVKERLVNMEIQRIYG